MRYVVLGMHKSGTTLMARLLHHTGIAMVEEISTEDYENDNFYERLASYHLNLAMLGEPGNLLLHPPPRRLNITQKTHERMKHLVNELNQTQTDWGFKDPRTCLVYEVWKDVLGDHKLLIVFRPVDDIWHRFDYHGIKIWQKLYNAIGLVQRWCEYNQAILTILQTTTLPNIVVSYPHLMQANDEFTRLEAFIGRPLYDQRKKRIISSQPSTYLLKLAKWLIHQRIGLDYDDIYQQLCTYRTQQMSTFLGQ